MSIMLSSAVASLFLAKMALADLTPTAPGPGEVYVAGENCTIKWDVDQSGMWKNVTIDLMSGSNTNMSLVTNVISGLDGTDATLTPFNWTCPQVDPYSTIYFYQFTNGEQTSQVSWTTRFTIASPDGEYIDPENSQQANGDPIPWGTGTAVPEDNADADVEDVEDESAPSCMSMERMEKVLRKASLGRRHSDKGSEDDDSGDSGKGSDSDSDSGDSEAKPKGKNSSGEGSDSEDKNTDDDDDEGSATKSKSSTAPKATHKVATGDAVDEEDSDSSPASSTHKVSVTHTSTEAAHTSANKSASSKADATSTASAQKSAKSGVKAKAAPSDDDSASSTADSSASPSAPTPGLPKKGNSSASASKTASSAPESTCQCSSLGQRSGLLSNRGKVRTVPVWALVLPLFIGLGVMY